MTLAYHDVLSWTPLVTTAIGSCIGALIAVIAADTKSRREAAAQREKRLKLAAMDFGLLAGQLNTLIGNFDQRRNDQSTTGALLELRDILERRRELADATWEAGGLALAADIAVRATWVRQVTLGFLNHDNEGRRAVLNDDRERGMAIKALQELAGTVAKVAQFLPFEVAPQGQGSAEYHQTRPANRIS